MSQFRAFRHFAATALMVISSTIAYAQQNSQDAKQNTATLRVRFLFKGNVINPNFIEGIRDPICAVCEIPDERLIVNNARELKNVVLLWDKRKNSKIPIENLEVAPHEEVGITNVGCRLEPHIIVARVGQELVLKNEDKTGHNTNVHLINNNKMMGLFPINEPRRIKLSSPEPAPVTVECNIHPWERAYLILTDHPFVGVSGLDGVLEIKNLPVGEVWFKIWHESSSKGFEHVMLNDNSVSLERSRIAFALNAGLNDVGVIELSEEYFHIPQPSPERK